MLRSESVTIASPCNRIGSPVSSSIRNGDGNVDGDRRDASSRTVVGNNCKNCLKSVHSVFRALALNGFPHRSSLTESDFNQLVLSFGLFALACCIFSLLYTKIWQKALAGGNRSTTSCLLQKKLHCGSCAGVGNESTAESTLVHAY